LARELRNNAISRAIEQRPSREALIASGIHEGKKQNVLQFISCCAGGAVAPGLQAMAKRLERNMVADNLKDRLHNRTDVSELPSGIVRGIALVNAMLELLLMSAGGDVAPRLRSTKVRLEQAIVRDQLGHLLESRPGRDELVRQGILTPSGNIRAAASAGALSAKIAGVQRQLQRQLQRDHLGQLLERRTDADQLQSQHIIGKKICHTYFF